MIRRVLASALMLSVLAGCGTHLAQPTSLTAQSLRAKALKDQGADLIAGLATMASTLNTFTATASFWETDGKATTTSTADVFLARPGKIRANINQASSALQRGAKVVYLGDKKVTVKLGPIKRTLAYDDPQVTAMHGWRIDQTDLTALIAGLTAASSQATAIGPVTVNGQAGQGVAVTGPALLPGVTKEVVVLDPTTFAPLRLEAFINDAPVYRIETSKVQLNPTLPSDIFNL